MSSSGRSPGPRRVPGRGGDDEFVPRRVTPLAVCVIQCHERRRIGESLVGPIAPWPATPVNFAYVAVTMGLRRWRVVSGQGGGRTHMRVRVHRDQLVHGGATTSPALTS
jgi:hypothetical protein